MTGRPLRICVLDDWEYCADRLGDWSSIAGRVEVRVSHEHLDGPQAAIQAIGEAEIVVVMRERTLLTRQVIAACPRLALIVTTGTRNNAIDLTACAEHGVTVCGTGPGTGPVVELAWSLILATTRRVIEAQSAIAHGGWATVPGHDLRGRTIGLLGLGRTGGRMAAIAQAFGMDVAAWSPNLTPERASEHRARLVSREELFGSSDIVSVHLVLSARTEGIVGARELALMKPTAWLVNTSRGPLVDEDALVSACRERRIAGAMIDVYSVEPLPAGHVMRHTPGLLATPHIGYVTEENLQSWFTDVVEVVAAWLDGQPLRVLTP
jgi:phosphoglycerate dehydrogenase-like enzyme